MTNEVVDLLDAYNDWYNHASGNDVWDSKKAILHTQEEYSRALATIILYYAGRAMALPASVRSSNEPISDIMADSLILSGELEKPLLTEFDESTGVPDSILYLLAAAMLLHHETLSYAMEPYTDYNADVGDFLVAYSIHRNTYRMLMYAARWQGVGYWLPTPKVTAAEERNGGIVQHVLANIMTANQMEALEASIVLCDELMKSNDKYADDGRMQLVGVKALGQGIQAVCEGLPMDMCAETVLVDSIEELKVGRGRKKCYVEQQEQFQEEITEEVFRSVACKCMMLHDIVSVLRESRYHVTSDSLLVPVLPDEWWDGITDKAYDTVYDGDMDDGYTQKLDAAIITVPELHLVPLFDVEWKAMRDPDDIANKLK